MRSSIVSLGLAVALAGCGKSKAQCRKEAEDLGQTLSAMDRSMGVETRFVKPVLRTDLPLTTDQSGQVMELSAAGTRVRFVADDPAPPEVALASLSSVRRAEPFEGLLLAIDEATPWSQVGELFDALEKAGARRVQVVFARPPTKQQPPPRSAVDQRLDAITVDVGPADKAVAIAKLAEELIADCDAVGQLFGALGGAAESKADRLVAGLPPALIACNCKCDVPSLKSLMWRILANQPPTTTVSLKLPPAALELPAQTPWREASQQLFPAARAAPPRRTTHAP